jgi:hypothetical protein
MQFFTLSAGFVVFGEMLKDEKTLTDACGGLCLRHC